MGAGSLLDDGDSCEVVQTRGYSLKPRGLGGLLLLPAGLPSLLLSTVRRKLPRGDAAKSDLTTDGRTVFSELLCSQKRASRNLSGCTKCQGPGSLTIWTHPGHGPSGGRRRTQGHPKLGQEGAGIGLDPWGNVYKGTGRAWASVTGHHCRPPCKPVGKKQSC